MGYVATGRKTGRPEKPIDWNIVEEALRGGCTGTEIAAWFNIHHDNFYRRVREEYGIDFTSFASSITPAGDMQLRMTQYRQALKGNTQLLLMLGEERLGQGKNKGENTHITQLNFKVNYDGDNNKVEILPEKLSAECTESPRQGRQEGSMVLPSESGKRPNDI